MDVVDLFNKNSIKIVRRFYHYKYWEDFNSGMYDPISLLIEDDYINKSIVLLSNSKELYNYMYKVLNEWPISSDHNLSNLSCNRRAWLGQSACFISHKSPSYITGKAWFRLDEKTQSIANKIADQIIEIYEKKYYIRNAKNILK